eukprot:gene621-335_t
MRDRWIGALQTHVSGLNQDDVDFLTEALANSEEADWNDILEPFFDDSDENQRAKKQEILADLKKKPKESSSSGSPSGYADTRGQSSTSAVPESSIDEPHNMRKAHDDPNHDNEFFHNIYFLVQKFFDVATTFRLRGVCKLAQRLDKRGSLWRPKAEYYSVLTGRPLEDVRDVRTYFFKELLPYLPRFDGVYIGNCSTFTIPRAGSSMATFLQHEDRTVGTHGIVGRYRRFLRMFPPELNADGTAEWPPRGRAIVLMDSGLKGNAGEELMLEIDPRGHENAGSPSITPESTSTATGPAQAQGKVTKEMLRGLVFSGWWQVHSEDEEDGGVLLQIKFVSTTTNNDSTMLMKLCHNPPSQCNLLKWRQYTLKAGDYIDEVDLGLDAAGEPSCANPNNHYPPYRLKRFTEL